MGHFLCVDRGNALPLGATRMEDGVNFALFAQHATHVWLSLFRPGQAAPFHEIALNPDFHRTGHIWHIWIGGLEPDFEYAYRLDRRPNARPEIHRYQPERYLLDPYAQVVVGGERWGVRAERRCALPSLHFDWGEDRPLNIPLSRSVLYELHVRSFTRHPSAAVGAPGTYRGLAEKIHYLKQLGVTAVELLPVYEFEEANTDRHNPLLGNSLFNLWGYQPISFFAPNMAYSSDPRPGAAVAEFKHMVRQFHQAGIEVILDVVFNHTAEGDERGQTFSFRGIDNSVYYLLEGDGTYRNFSGCGNTFNCNHPVVRALIADCLRYWVMEMHVDGFRFDLASILGRGQDGTPLANPPLLERLAYDPVLANTKLIAEAWDAGGLYQVGSFPAWGRWAEWNGRYRDDLRRFLKSDGGMVPALMNRLQGSPDIYAVSGRQAYHSINFITAHDGFTLNDLFSFNEKHNDANGEHNRDGANDNYSWNCGFEGPSPDASINALRRRLMRNAAVLLLTSGGVPMLLAGDEFARTQHGNNNAYCQDNETSWLDWTLARTNAEQVELFRRLIEFRLSHEAFAHLDWAAELGAENTRVRFHGTEVGRPDTGPDSRSLAMELEWEGERVYLIANSYWEELGFEVPEAGGARTWQVVVDTTARPLGWRAGRYVAGPRSAVLLEAI